MELGSLVLTASQAQDLLELPKYDGQQSAVEALRWLNEKIYEAARYTHKVRVALPYGGYLQDTVSVLRASPLRYEVGTIGVTTHKYSILNIAWRV